nr:MAG TPA: tail protein [Caudoviricetes sp.]
MIKLFESSERSFKSNGFGVLSDTLTCVVKETLNGEYELEMTYPVTGKHFSDIEYARILYAKPNVHDDPQPFRIYEISAEIDGKITVNAEHISYDASGIPIWPVAPYYVDTPSQLIQYISNHSIVDNPFTMSTDITTVRQLNFNTPRSMRSLMGTDDNSLLSWYGGEWKYDKFKMELLQQRGSDKGIYIRYGKNLLDLNQERNIQSTYSGVLPYYYNEDDGFQYLSERIIACPGNHAHTKIYTLDLSSEFQEMPTESDLRTKTNEFISKNQLGIPAVNLTVSFLAIDEVRKTLLDVELGDIVHIRFPEMNIISDARVISYEYDVVAGRYSSIELGKTVSTIVDSITDIGEHINNINKTIEKEAERTTVRFEALDDRIESEVTTLRGADKRMASLITQTADAISSEVSRATKTENRLSSLITQTAEEVSFKVTANDVSSMISQSASTIRMQASKLVVKSDNFNLDASGNIVAAYCKFLCAPGTGVNMDNENGLWFNQNGIHFRYYSGRSSANGGKDSRMTITDSRIGLSSGCVNISADTVFTWGGGGTMNASEKKYVATREWVRQQGYATGTIPSLSGYAKTGSGNTFTANQTFTGKIYNPGCGTSTGSANCRIQNGTYGLAKASGSSKRFKHDVTSDINSELDPHRLYDINVVQYKYNDDYLDKNDQRYQQDVIGFIAEDILDKYPIAADLEDKTELTTVELKNPRVSDWNFRFIVPPMLKLIQEQNDRIKKLEELLIERGANQNGY